MARGPLLGAKAQALKGALKSELRKTPTGRAPGRRPTRGRTSERELTSTRLQVGRLGGRGRGALKKLGSDMLGMPLDVFGGSFSSTRSPWRSSNWRIRAHKSGQSLAFDREVAAEVEQGALADLVGAAFAFNEPVGVIGFAVFGCAGPGASDETWREDIRAPGTPQ